MKRLALLALLALGSCTAARVEVEAYLDGGRLGFRVPDDQIEDANCFTYFGIIDARGELMWHLNGAGHDPKTGKCPAAFPAHYGETPPGTKTVVAPRPLVPGTLYVVQGYAAISPMEGAFRFTGTPVRTVEKISPENPATIAADQAYQNTHPDLGNQTETAANATAN